MKRYRILHVFGKMNRGGAETRTLELLRHLDPQRFEFHFWAISSEFGELDGEITTLGGRVFYAGQGANRWLSLLTHLRKSKYDVVHSNVFFASGVVLAIAQIAGVPVRIAHFRTTDDGRGNAASRRVYRLSMRKLLDKCATRFIAVSEGAMLAAWGPTWREDSRCTVIYGGVNCAAGNDIAAARQVRSELNIPDNCTLVIHIGRMMEAKNHRRLLALFKALLTQRTDCRLLLVGRSEPVLAAHLEQLALQLGVHEAVIFGGLRGDVPRLLHAADIMIFPSIWEGLPGAVLEAVSLGVPVLCSDIPGCLEIARHTNMVQCLPLQRSDTDWVAAAEVLLCRYQARNRSARFSPLLGTVFDAKVSARRFEELYTESLRTCGAAAATQPVRGVGQ